MTPFARLVEMRFRNRWAFAGLLGIAAAFGQAPFSLWGISLLALAGLAMCLDSTHNIKQAALIGWAAGIGYFGLTLHWIVEPFMVDAARHGWMAPFALIAISGGLALFWALGFGLARWLGGARWSALALIVTLTFTELLRSYVFTGFPWGLIAYVWADASPMQIAGLVGPHGLGALTLLLTSGVYGITALPRPRAILAAGVIVALFAGLTMITRPGEITMGAEPGPVVRVVQPNAPQHQKWDPDWMPVFFGRALEATAAPGSPDLIIWPETSIPALLRNAEFRLAEMANAAQGTPIIAGIQRWGGTGYHNSLVLIGADGSVDQTYDKQNLVPFGEYIPFGDMAARLGIAAFAAQEGFGYAPGPGPQLLTLPGALGRALPLICYEAIFPQDVGAAPARPDWLLQITNDAWFGEFAGPQQHLAQAQFRAVEQGLPLIRAANTGISAVIDPQGRIQASLPMGQTGHIDTMLPPALPPTLYSRTNDAPIWVLLILCMGGMAALRTRFSD